MLVDLGRRYARHLRRRTSGCHGDVAELHDAGRALDFVEEMMKWARARKWIATRPASPIGAKDDKKTYAALSYTHVANVHVLEHLIRFAFKKGVDNLSDILQGE